MWSRFSYRVHRLIQMVCLAYPALCKPITHLRQIVFRYDPEALEMQNLVMTIGAGFWIIWTGNEKRSADSLIYLLLTRSLPYWAWGIIFILVGIGQLGGMLKNSIRWRAVAAMMSFVLWSFLAVLLTVGVVPGPPVVIFAVLAASEAWIYLRLALHNNQQRHNVEGQDEGVPCPSSALFPN